MDTDLYKLYGNKVMCRVENAGFGTSVGGVGYAAQACADDITMMSKSKELQRLIFMAYSHSIIKDYILQPLKCVDLVVEPTKPRLKSNGTEYTWTLGGVEMFEMKTEALIHKHLSSR